ncbi:hypothetical protein M405DRAFT_856497 [Rhizopogon salebrosus TDB-379]|nr:hypothetical protein M405DRAFT_856497 [Rhizopogon salebrosus TDB-379]
MAKFPALDGGGLRSTHLFDEANDIIELALNEQSALLWEWRTRIHALLTQKLAANGDQAEGEEYSRTLKTQSEVKIYMQAYAALLADRREAISAERTLLAVHDGQEQKVRRTKAAARAATRAIPDDDFEIPENVDVQPQHEVLHRELTEQSKEIHEQFSGRALKSVMVDLSVIAARIASTKDLEKIVARDGANSLRTLTAQQVTLTDKLDADLGQLRKVQRTHPEISDTVTEVVWDGTAFLAMEECDAERRELEDKINTSRARQRYLDHIAKTKDGVNDEESNTWILVDVASSVDSSPNVRMLSARRGCMRAWLGRAGKACPASRAIINVDQLQRFTIEAEKPAPAKPVMANQEPAPMSRRDIQHIMIDPRLFEEIQTMESTGSYGSKIQTLIRHLLYIQYTTQAQRASSSRHEPIHCRVEYALKSNGISYLRPDQAKGRGKDGGAKRFRTDPTLQVLLLHGERDNAGLNVTCASRMFLIESVVNHGFEVQAIARIDRMGQTKPTEVFCYYAEGDIPVLEFNYFSSLMHALQ